ncbi:hypothetical protein Avbf_04518 [Armadillidium vulgare]|nr:hypothetical protein Avbf_04518 [Armadillidium vulgare]
MFTYTSLLLISLNFNDCLCTVFTKENDSKLEQHIEFLKLEFKKLRSKLDEFNSSMTATLSADRRQKIVVDHSPMLKSLKPGLGSKMNMSYFRNLLQLPILKC